MALAHTHNIRVYYEDTDAGGVVYHSNFLKFAERGRCELLRDIGYQCSDIQDTLGMMFVMKHAEINFIKPAFLDEALDVVTSVAEMKNTSFKMRQIVRRDEKPICEMLVTMVCVEPKAIKPVRLPDVLKGAFEQYLESES